MSKFKPTVEQLGAALKRSAKANDAVGVDRAADELIERAWEGIEADDAELPMRAAKILQDAGHPAGYEIAALSLDHRDEPQKAIEILEKGVKEIADVWRLWELLGNLRSDQKLFAEAAEAFARALACPEPATASIRFNIALTCCRQAKFAEAIESLDRVGLDTLEDRELRLNCFALKTAALNSLERCADAEALARKVIDSVHEEDFVEEEAPHLAELHAQLARALGAGGKIDEALTHAHDAISIDPGNELALELIRNSANLRSASAQMFTLTVSGTWPEPIDEDSQEPPEFVQSFSVIADTVDEAMQLVRDISPEPLRDSLQLQESETVKPLPDEAKGVCQISPYVFVDLEEDDSEGETS
jgi:tetratricopeptide (TPR) repeat protein